MLPGLAKCISVCSACIVSLFCEANPIPVKWACQQLGLITGGIRLPLTPLSPEYHERVRAAMRQAGCWLDLK